MKINSIQQQNNISHKAYFKPNNHFNKIFGHQALVQNCDETLLKKFRELPNHEIEIVDIICRDKNVSYGEFSCTVVNNTTHKALNLIVEKTYEKMDRILGQLTNNSHSWVRKFYEKDDKVTSDYINLTKSSPKIEI